jgi:hypothetical protein
MSKIAECLNKLDELGFMAFDNKIEVNQIIFDGKKVPKELLKDMERAERIELQSFGNEVTGYKGRSIVFTAGGDFEIDDQEFEISSYFSKNFMIGSKSKGKLAPNTVNSDKFQA